MNLTEVSNRLEVQLALAEGNPASRSFYRNTVLRAFDASVLGLAAKDSRELVPAAKFKRVSAWENPITNLLTDVKPEDSDDIFFLTQVILNTLNSEPAWFHNMFEIPGLELQSREHLSQVTKYLLGQGWIELKPATEQLLVRLTIQGKLFLSANLA